MARGERRFRLTLHYDGTRFFGWQLQPKERTVQGELQSTLERLTGARRTVIAAGRTDRGVHATGQVVAVDLPRRWTAATLHRALNATLPRDIWVAEAHAAPPTFHPRHDASAREYGYRLGLSAASGSPFHRAWCWPLARSTRDAVAKATDLDVAALHAAAALLPGEKSFVAFARAGQEERGDRCDVTAARWGPWPLGMEFTVVANRFLHRMVRYLVGTMVDVALGRRPMDDMRAMLEGEVDHPVTSPPAPAAGLFLRRVSYPAGVLSRRAPMSDGLATGAVEAPTSTEATGRSNRPVRGHRPVRFPDTEHPRAGSANHS